ncbi:MAG: glucose dehydrogenase [Acidimicrobiaceae bacterium]|nr:glucose dehydrogenase [Acidimicrobiaceae bacterium]
MRRFAGGLVALLTVVAACGGDGDDARDDESSAVIVTTTTAVPESAPTTGATTPATTTPAATTPDVPAVPTTTSPGASSSTPDATTSPTSTGPTTSADTSAPATDQPAPEPTVGDPYVGTEVVVTTDRPVDLAVRSGDAALYVVNQTGTIVRVDPATGDAVTMLDVSGQISTGGERGLLGLAFSPDGALAYTNHTAADGATVITEFAVAADGTIDGASARPLLTVSQPYSNHNAGDLAFGPDGMLYVPLGDGGSAGDPERRAGDPTSLLGSLLRIDPTPSGDAPYTIPPDNPFASGQFAGLDGAPEVWAHGLRNPWKIAFDPRNGDLWIADVGQNLLEEVNRVGAVERPAGYGLDFGWSGYEGTEVFNDDDVRDGTTLPVLTYEHGADGCSVSGGVPYRGRAIDDLEPAYVYGDYCSGIVWALDLAGGRNLRLLDGLSELTAVRAGPDGEIYLLQGSGEVRRLIAG